MELFAWSGLWINDMGAAGNNCASQNVRKSFAYSLLVGSCGGPLATSVGYADRVSGMSDCNLIPSRKNQNRITDGAFASLVRGFVDHLAAYHHRR